jgi:hypothetical protein
MGWKGVGVWEAFGAVVTNAKGKAGWALTGTGARFAHPASSSPARRIAWKRLFMCYGKGVKGVFVIVGIGGAIMVSVDVAGGGCVEVGSSVVGMGSDVFVDVGKSGTAVVPGMGVRVGKFGTQSLCPG